MRVRDEIVSACKKIQSQGKLKVAEDASLVESTFTWIGVQNESLSLWQGKGAVQKFPNTFLQKVLGRYGQPLGKVGDIVAHIEVPGGGILAHMIYVPEFDVVPKDYIVWIPNKGDPVFALSALLIPPLVHLVHQLIVVVPPGRDSGAECEKK